MGPGHPEGSQKQLQLRGHLGQHVWPLPLPACLATLGHQLPGALGPVTNPVGGVEEEKGRWTCLNKAREALLSLT